MKGPPGIRQCAAGTAEGYFYPSIYSGERDETGLPNLTERDKRLKAMDIIYFDAIAKTAFWALSREQSP